MRYLTPEVVAKVQQHLAAGHSIRETAKLIGCSRWVVTEIHHGRHRLRYRNPARRDTSFVAWEPHESRKPWRCSCGLLVRTKTCLRCAVVKQKERA